MKRNETESFKKKKNCSATLTEFREEVASGEWKYFLNVQFISINLSNISGNNDKVKELIGKGIDVNKIQDGWLALNEAAEKGTL